MGLADIIVIAAIVLIIGLALAYIIISKKRVYRNNFTYFIYIEFQK